MSAFRLSCRRIANIARTIQPIRNINVTHINKPILNKVPDKPVAVFATVPRPTSPSQSPAGNQSDDFTTWDICVLLAFLGTVAALALSIDEVPVSGRLRIRVSDFCRYMGLNRHIGVDSPFHVIVGEKIRNKEGDLIPLTDEDVTEIARTIIGARGVPFSLKVWVDGKIGESRRPQIFRNNFELLITRDDGIEDVATFNQWVATNVALQVAYADNRVKHEDDLAVLIPRFFHWSQSNLPKCLVSTNTFRSISIYAFNWYSQQALTILREADQRCKNLLKCAGFDPESVTTLYQKPEKSQPNQFFEAAIERYVIANLHLNHSPLLMLLTNNPHSKIASDELFYLDQRVWTVHDGQTRLGGMNVGFREQDSACNGKEVVTSIDYVPPMTTEELRKAHSDFVKSL